MAMQVFETSRGFIVGREGDDGRITTRSMFGSAEYLAASPNVRKYSTYSAARTAIKAFEDGLIEYV